MTVPPPLARCIAILLVSITAGCASDPSDLEAVRQDSRPNVAPSRQVTSGTLQLANPRIKPMYRERLTVDLESVVGVARLDNVGILEAKQRVEA